MLAAAIAVACAPEELENTEKVSEAIDDIEKIFVSIVDESTRVQLNSKVQTVWNAGDEIMTFHPGGTVGKYSFQGNTGDRSGVFKQFYSGYYQKDPGFAKHYAIYPADLMAGLGYVGSDPALLFMFSDVQYYTENSYGVGSNVMVAESDDPNDFKFRNMSSFFRFNITGTKKVAQVSLKGNDSEVLSGEFFFMLKDMLHYLLEQQMLLEDAAEGAAQLDSDADLMFRDISGFKDSEIPKAYQLIDQVTRRINGEIVARRRRTGRSEALDFRRTIRAGLSTGGALCRLRHKPHHSRRKRIVMLCDVSGSMLQFSEFAIRFIKSLSEISDHSEIFLFSEQVQRVNPFALQNMDLFNSYVRTSGVWGRGTNVGRALDAVLGAAPPVLTPNTVVLVLSDAKSVSLDRAEASLMRTAKAAGSVIWMNPIPESKWPYLKSVTRLRQHCSMVPCGTLDELARACQRLIGG
jgi:hypothetical protein